MKLLAAGLLLSAAVAFADHGLDEARPHHTAQGFRNNYIPQVDKPPGDLLRWRLQAWREGLPPPPRAMPPVAPPELERLRANTRALRSVGAAARAVAPSVTWIGHATALLQCGGLNVLTDPIFSERASPLPLLGIGPKRAQPPGIALPDLPPIDVVLISHNHYDHLDLASLEGLDERSGGQTLFLVPLGVKALLTQHGLRHVVELDWWQSHWHGGVEFHLVPVQHWSARGFGDRNHTLWGGWAVFAPDLRWYFAGDTGYTRDFADTRRRFASRAAGGPVFDLALLPIGAYEPRWFMSAQHMNPAEAVQAHRDLGARRSLGVHWGTFELTDEALDQPPRDLAAARSAAGIPEADFFVLAIGETRWLPAMQGQSPHER
ncbi:MBL fold metallo-hydrolase [Ramlibacter solisilvae]|uniref:Beta-lactamase n=1 Tax=Ramlibacter tataouinensis TaxID=94132 RepID=A0A127JSR7_9BURK|nr:MBL fold metallo-hydrolase [Ramlibacter tataouinensis]AMO22959.1 beta-lactamase [Ramlibacter tataouinensis]